VLRAGDDGTERPCEPDPQPPRLWRSSVARVLDEAPRADASPPPDEAAVEDLAAAANEVSGHSLDGVAGERCRIGAAGRGERPQCARVAVGEGPRIDADVLQEAGRAAAGVESGEPRRPGRRRLVGMEGKARRQRHRGPALLEGSLGVGDGFRRMGVEAGDAPQAFESRPADLAAAFQ
jgi:hypothetical protein